MNAELGSGTELTVRGSTSRELMASIPPVGADLMLGLHREDTVLIRAEAD